MILLGARGFIFSILFVVFSFNFAFAEVCEEYFQEHIDPLEVLEALEIRTNQLPNVIWAHESSSNKTKGQVFNFLAPELDQFRLEVDKFLDEMSSFKDKSPQIKSHLGRLERKLDTIESDLFLKLEREATTDFMSLMENPLLLQPKKVYPIEATTGPYEVVFSESVVKDVFRYKSSDDKMRAKKFMRSFLNGRQSNNSHVNGIKPLHGLKDVFEVKIRCKEFGKCRIFGYFDESRFYAVTFTTRHDHHKDYSRAASKVRNYRANQ